LKEPVGFTVSFLSRRLPTPSWSASVGDVIRGVCPSPCDTIDILSVRGSSSKYRHIELGSEDPKDAARSVFIATTVGALHPSQLSWPLAGAYTFEQTGHFKEYLAAASIPETILPSGARGSVPSRKRLSRPLDDP